MKKNTQGFTLDELMVVIAIIAILTGIMLASFSGAKAQSRDLKRVSDLSQLQLALAGFFNRCGVYPANLTIGSGESSCTSAGTTIKLSTFMSTVPTAPNTGEVYVYSVDAGLDDYFLHATLENNNKASNNSLASVPQWYTPGVACSTSTKDFCVGPK